MTRRVTISVPDDVADQLAALPPRQVSAYVAEALRRRHGTEGMREALRAAGHPEYPHDPEGDVVRAAEGLVSPEVRERSIARVAEMLGVPIDQLRDHLNERAET